TTGDPHPIAWYKEFDGGRSWYTGGGHTPESFREADFVQHVWGGMQWASNGTLDYRSAHVVPSENRFEKVVLVDDLDEPMELDMLPDGRLLFVERKGDIKIYDPESEKLETVDHLDIHTEFEDGLLGVALDPNFADNHWIYVFYSPLGDEPKQHVSRFDFVDDKLVRDSEKVLLEIVTQRDECCHSGGSVEFGPDGNLWFSAGDDTNPFASDGYSPSDERPGRSAWDAQKSSSNTMDLRGKVCRITPQPDGTYTIPDGNLFPKDGSVGRPEIYAMGCRNPYRISIDSKTGFLYWGDVGPDAGKDSTGRGPRGHDEVNQARQAGFFGWPYFVGNNKAYHEYDFATKTSLDPYDAELPINNSPNNTGARELPPAQPAFIYYPYAESKEFPLVGTGGRNAMAGPVFYADAYPDSEARFPNYYDGKLFTYDWIRGWIMAVTMDEQGNFVDMERFMPSHKFSNPNDIIMGPQGDFYMLEYGTAWFKRNKDARLVHIQYQGGNRTPVAHAIASADAGSVPFTVQFEGSNSVDPDGDELTYRWDFGDGQSSNQVDPMHTFQEPGTYKVALQVTDQEGNQSTTNLNIGAGNDPPRMKIDIAGNESFYWPGEELRYVVQVEDKEDGSVGEGISEEAVALSINYLPQGKDINMISLGHQELAENSKFLTGKELIQGSDCRACHLSNAKSVGPSYLQVAQKYRDQSDAVPYLADKILNGGGGVWGEQAMAAHPQLSKEEAELMTKYILSISERTEDDRLPPRGSYVFDPGQSGEQGSYVLMASYTDKGSGEIAPIEVQEVVTLVHPRMAAADIEDSDVASAFELNEEQLNQLTIKNLGSNKIVLCMNDGWVSYRSLDLTGISALKLGVSLTPEHAHGGTILIRKGSEDGPELGRLTIDFESKNFGFHQHVVPLQPTQGLQELYLTFEGNNDKMLGVLLTIEFLKGDDVL
nr:PQQ-dependent sugar dehydrogenase [Saprospiraceae bacterium]